MANKTIVNFANCSSVKVSEWKVEIGQTIYHGRVLLVYEDDTSGKLSKLKSKCVGTVVNLLVKEGEILNPGDPVLEVEEGCRHPTVINDLCAECGADLQREGVSESNATVPMVHHIPQLKVSQQEAEMIGKADTERLLKDRKLVLLVDLDQTLIHTTHDNIPNNIKDVHHFQLGTSAWYHTRLRPNTGHFLKEMSAFFELHICTFGVRPYAHMVANILDRDHSLFGSRILSRDECFSFNSKVANLQALFPNGDELVCIIDDRKDVWNNSPNLVPVKPYVFFTNTGDINDINLPPITKHSDFFAKGVKLTKREAGGEGQAGEGDLEVDSIPKVEHSEEFDVEDEDDYLLYLETILKKVHQLFYKVYDKEVEGTPHVRWVLEQLRGSVLKGCEIVFSGLVPLHEVVENSEPYLMATDLGAKIEKNVSPTTTHIVAAREGTAKLHESKKFPDIKIVNPQWLISCLYRWEKVDERLFPLVKMKTNEKKCKEVPLALSFDDVVSMQQEVKAEFNSDSSDSVLVDSTDEEEETCIPTEEMSVESKKACDDGEQTESSLNDSEDLLTVFREPCNEAESSSFEISDLKNSQLSEIHNDLPNISNIMNSHSCLKRKAESVVLDNLRNNSLDAPKKFRVPKKVRICDKPIVHIIENREEDLYVSTSKNMKKLDRIKRQKIPPPLDERFVQKEMKESAFSFDKNVMEHSPQINWSEELKHLNERHNLLMQNAINEHLCRINHLQSEHSLRLRHIHVEHETRLANMNWEHQAAMKLLLR